MKKMGFTLVEIMIVVAIIGLLSAIAIPNYNRARVIAERNTCIVNLKHIQGAIQVWALEYGKSGTETPSESDLTPQYMRQWPTCRGNAYALPEVDADPVCPSNISDHTL